jgi:hypothetical protein
LALSSFGRKGPALRYTGCTVALPLGTLGAQPRAREMHHYVFGDKTPQVAIGRRWRRSQAWHMPPSRTIILLV